MTEELAFQQVFRDGPAVDDHQGLLRAVAQLVDGPREALLPRSALTLDQDGIAGSGDPSGPLDKLQHGLRGCNHALDGRLPGHRLFEFGYVLLEP